MRRPLRHRHSRAGGTPSAGAAWGNGVAGFALRWIPARAGRTAGCGALLALAGCATVPPAADWRVEAERPAVVRFARDGIEVDTPAGLTLWYGRPIRGPVAITFEAMAVAAGGPNDRVSDLNAFWMAREPDGAGPKVRSGAFADYDTLRLYYVGIGGNANSSTRMRRYVGQAGVRPIRPEHDRAAPGDLLVANRWTRVRLVADGRRIAVARDGRPLFTMDDAAPYTDGWFGLRTTQSHLRFRKLRITRP